MARTTRVPVHPCRLLDGIHGRDPHINSPLTTPAQVPQRPAPPEELIEARMWQRRRQHIADLCDEWGTLTVLRLVHEYRRARLTATA